MLKDDKIICVLNDLKCFLIFKNRGFESLSQRANSKERLLAEALEANLYEAKINNRVIVDEVNVLVHNVYPEAQRVPSPIRVLLFYPVY